MSARWESLLITAKPLVSFIEEGRILSQPYNGETVNRILIHDQYFARACASYPPPDGFTDWNEATEGAGIFNDDFEWASWIDKKLSAKNFFNARLNNATLIGALRDADGDGGFLELIERDVMILLHCYANDHFPPIWKLILDAYLHYGFPCGWSTEGKLAIFCLKNSESS